MYIVSRLSYSLRCLVTSDLHQIRQGGPRLNFGPRRLQPTYFAHNLPHFATRALHAAGHFRMSWYGIASSRFLQFSILIYHRPPQHDREGPPFHYAHHIYNTPEVRRLTLVRFFVISVLFSRIPFPFHYQKICLVTYRIMYPLVRFPCRPRLPTVGRSPSGRARQESGSLSAYSAFNEICHFA
jgi:hypothetical protein